MELRTVQVSVSMYEDLYDTVGNRIASLGKAYNDSVSSYTVPSDVVNKEIVAVKSTLAATSVEEIVPLMGVQPNDDATDILSKEDLTSVSIDDIASNIIGMDQSGNNPKMTLPRVIFLM